MLDLALIGSPLPENKFKIFDHYGIYLPEDFFTNYIDDLSSLSYDKDLDKSSEM